MAITKITATHNGKKALEYLTKDKGHNGNERRNNFISGYNMVSPDAVPYDVQMEKYWNRKSEKTKVEVRRVTQSFSRNELNPDDDNDVFKAHEIGIETGRLLFPDRQFIVATQTDGKSGLVHNHIFVNNINMVTNRGMHKSEYDYRKVRSVSDEVVKGFGVDFDYGEKSEKYSQTERAKRAKDEYVWKDDLRDRVREAMSDAENWDEFKDNLEALGVEGRFGKKSITYTLVDTSNYESEFGEAPKQDLKCRANKLGDEFDHEHIEETFTHNQGQFTEESEVITAPVVSPAKEDDEDEEVPSKVKVVEPAAEKVEEPETAPETVTEVEQIETVKEFEPDSEEDEDDEDFEDAMRVLEELISEQERVQTEVTEKVTVPTVTEMDMTEDDDKRLREEAERIRAERISKLSRSNGGNSSIAEIYEKSLEEHSNDKEKT